MHPCELAAQLISWERSDCRLRIRPALFLLVKAERVIEALRCWSPPCTLPFVCASGPTTRVSIEARPQGPDRDHRSSWCCSNVAQRLQLGHAQLPWGVGRECKKGRYASHALGGFQYITLQQLEIWRADPAGDVEVVTYVQASREQEGRSL